MELFATVGTRFVDRERFKRLLEAERDEVVERIQGGLGRVWVAKGGQQGVEERMDPPFAHRGSVWEWKGGAPDRGRTLHANDKHPWFVRPYAGRWSWGARAGGAA